MFKPHFGVCTCHGLKRLIVLKSGICKQKNDEIKKEKRSKRLERSVSGKPFSMGRQKLLSRTKENNFGKRTGINSSGYKRKQGIGSSSTSNISDATKDDKQSSEKTSFVSSASNPKQFNRTGNRRPTKLQKVRKPTGELILFKEIYEERGPYSQISGEYVEFNVWCFSHILPKGNYSRFRLDKRNIIIKTPQEHHAWHTETHKLKLLPEWKWVFELYEQLKIEYNETGRTKS